MKKNQIGKSIFYETVKRVVDIILAGVLGIVFLPVVIFCATVIKLGSKGPVLADTPERVGKNGRLFKMYKFRSMIKNAHDLLRENPKFGKLYQEYKKSGYKLKKDPRITSFGNFMRKHSLDEIPQLINVLRGEMSIVGPRAYYPDELREQQEKYPQTRGLVRVVLSIKPGITGAWQVSGRSEINFDKRIQIDALYVRKRSIIYDIMVILKTPWAMISGRGAL